MKVKVTLELELELSDEVSSKDNGLVNMVNDDIIENLSDIDMDFQSSDDKDIQTNIINGALIKIK
jgi:hypothetical protein